MDINGVVKRVNEYFTLYMIDKDEYSKRKHIFKIKRDWNLFIRGIYVLEPSIEIAEKVMKLAGYYDKKEM